jgi:hypothetical protein
MDIAFDSADGSLVVTNSTDGTEIGTGSIGCNATVRILMSDSMLPEFSGVIAEDGQTIEWGMTDGLILAPWTRQDLHQAIADGTASASGDPHFKIGFANQYDICFDLSGPDGTNFNLIYDPISGLEISGSIRDFKYKQHKSHRLGNIKIKSPENVQLKLDLDEIVISYDQNNSEYFTYNEQINDLFGDVKIETHSLNKYRRHGVTIQVDNSIFEIQLKEEKESIKFYVDDETHFTDHNLNGLLGYIMTNSYQVVNGESLVIGNQEFKYSVDNSEGCLRLDNFDVQLFNRRLTAEIKLKEIKSPK